tara:strand:+ start:377 stop:1129 length:753 start_codon:yes stop_codon:yes gene_type:complete
MKSLILTGATGGIGSQIAKSAQRKNYNVGLIDINEEKLESLSKEVPNSIPLPADITNEESVVSALDTFGKIPDCLVNCAGIVRYGSLLEQSAEDFKRVLEVNLLGTFIVSRSVAKLMIKQQSGNIVNISSISGGKHPAVNTGGYAASKSGVAMLSEQMSLEFGKEGIRVNTVSPGFINSGMSAPHYTVEEERQKREGMVPLRRLGSADDISRVVMFLLSDESSYIHGENIIVDGGVMNSVLANISRKQER